MSSSSAEEESTMREETTTAERSDWWDRFGSQIPKRPLSAFFHYSMQTRDAVKSQNPNFTFADLAREIARRYKDLTPEGRAPYEEQYQRDKERYQQLTNAYQELRQAGHNGDLETLRKVITTHRQEESISVRPEALDLDTILCYALRGPHGITRQTKYKTVAFAEYLVQSLHDAADNGNVDTCEFLVQRSKVGELWERGRNILRREEEVDNDSDTDDEGFREGLILISPELHHPLVVAAKNRHSAVVKALLCEPAKPLVQAFWKACDSSRWGSEIVFPGSNSNDEDDDYDDHFDETRYDPNSCRIALLESARLLLDNGVVPLDFAVLLQEGLLVGEEVLDEWLEYWSNTHPTGRDSEGNNILHIACKSPRVSVSLVKAIMERSPAAVDELDDRKGLLPIHHACICDLDLDVVFTLGEHKPETLGRFGALLV